jgi:ribosomal protein S18 acetylase RimI-like enzyme
VGNRAVAIVRLDAAQIDAAADVLARAFFDYPIWPWMIPDEAQRREVMPWFMRMSLRWGFFAAETYVTAPEVRGVAMWEMLPERDVDHGDAELDAMWESAPARIGADGWARFEAMIATQRPIRERECGGGPLWYLPWLGVDPALQQSGIGAALLTDMFERIDADGVACLLETEKEANVPYYERHGFRVVEAGVLPLDGPRFWTMRRDPPAT